MRWQTDLDGQTREIAIIRVALLNRLDYAFNQHVPRHTAPEGMSDELCHAIKDWQASTLFDAKQRAVLAYADAMTLNVQGRTMCSTRLSRTSTRSKSSS